jgi:hypothetical protein
VLPAYSEANRTARDFSDKKTKRQFLPIIAALVKLDRHQKKRPDGEVDSVGFDLISATSFS